MNEQDSLFEREAAPSPANTGRGSASPFSSAPGSAADLDTRLKTTQRQLSNVLILMLVISGTFTIFLLQQVRYDRANLGTLGPQEQQLQQARQLIANYNEKSVPMMQKFINDLAEFSKTHPSVLPILARYGLTRPATPPANGTSGQNH